MAPQQHQPSQSCGAGLGYISQVDGEMPVWKDLLGLLSDSADILVAEISPAVSDDARVAGHHDPLPYRVGHYRGLAVDFTVRSPSLRADASLTSACEKPPCARGARSKGPGAHSDLGEPVWRSVPRSRGARGAKHLAVLPDGCAAAHTPNHRRLVCQRPA